MKKRESLGLALNLSWTMLFSLVSPLMAGIWLDSRLDTAPLLTLIGALLGILAATVGVARMAMRAFGHIDRQQSDQLAGENDEEEPE